MIKHLGKLYVKGTLDITPRAQARLTELGVVLRKNHYPEGGEFAGFYLPEGNDGNEFHHIGGSPAMPGSLSLSYE